MVGEVVGGSGSPLVYLLTNSRHGPFGRVQRMSPLEDDAILIRFWKRRTILQETGPLAMCEGSARLKKTPSLLFDLKIVGTTI